MNQSHADSEARSLPPGKLTDNSSITTESSLGPPPQHYRPVYGMHHRRAGSPRLDQVGLQREIPFRRSVRVIDEHQPRIVFQAFGLPDHGLLILTEKNLTKHSENRGRQEKQIPRRHEIDPAQVPPHRRHRRAAGEPQLPAAILLRADVRQHEIDRRRYWLPGDFLEQPVRCAVGARRMRAHPETVGYRLEPLGFLVNASAFPPEPRLVHERPMRRVHQSNNPVVDMRRQLARKMRDCVFAAENGKRRRRRNGVRQPRPRRIHINPNVAVAFFARTMPRKDAFHFQFVLAGKRWNLDTLPGARLEPPPVVAALHYFSVESSV